MIILQRLFNVFRLRPNYDNRVFGLDLMRALAIIFVVIGHGGWILDKANTHFPWIRFIDGVELFFVLSGFLIGGILIKIFQNTKSLKLKAIWDFWIRRWFRTLPNYYLVLVLNIVVVYFGIIKEDFAQFNWKFFLFLQNFSKPFYGFFWESWSLSIEEWFYLFFPIFLGILYLTLNRFKISKKLIFLCSIFIFLLFPFLLRLFIASKFEVDDFWLGVKIYKVVVYRLDGIALGLLAAFIKYRSPKFWFKSRNISFLAGIVIGYAILYTTWYQMTFQLRYLKYFFKVLAVSCFYLCLIVLKKPHLLLPKYLLI
jgi:peptidoglycan/LPS O-acetylase OafA/YrhL